MFSYDLFTQLVRCSFLGGKQLVNGENFTLEPTLLRRYDLIRSKPEFGSKTQMNRLFTGLSSDFKGTARSELYRKRGGWIEKSYQERKVKQFEIEDIDHFLVPILNDKNAVGIDTSSDGDTTYTCIAFFDNYNAGYHFLENILNIPRSRTGHSEFKWNKLNKECRNYIDKNLEYLLKISAQYLMMIKTNALRRHDEKLIDVFIKLIDGWFTNYNHNSSRRLTLRRDLFKFANETPIHCDADFQPLTPGKIVRHFIKVLANGNKCEALRVEKDSHESEPIQVTDILCGALKQHIIKKKRGFLTPWEFDNKLKSKHKERYAKCYLWKFK